MDIASFENHLDEAILKRGRTYFAKGCVKDLEQVDDGVWRASVEGTEIYDTTVTIVNNEITYHRCSCPYDFGEYCKHEVAVLYAVRQDLRGDPVVPKNPKKYRTVRDEIQNAIGQITEQELHKIVVEHALENKKFRREILNAVPCEHNKSPSQVKEAYMDSISSCMEENAGRYGAIGYYEALYASEEAHALCEKARQYVDSGNYVDALPIGQALLEAIYPELGSIDDSDGEFGSCLDEGWDILRKTADNVPSESELGGELFEYCLKQAGKKIYEGWSTEIDFFEIASRLIGSEKKMAKLFSVIDRVVSHSDEEDSWNSEYMVEKAARIKLNVLRKLGKNDDADFLMQKSIVYPDIREIYLQDLFSAKKFNEAKKIANDGILIAEKKNHPGIEWQFKEWLCRIAEAENDVLTVRKFLREFFLDRYDPSYYRKLKDSFKNDRRLWDEEFKVLVSKLREVDAGWALLDLFVSEEKWEDFLAQVFQICRKDRISFLPNDNNLSLLEHYEKIMRKHFSEELVSLYADEIKKSLKGAPQGRCHYQYICRLLRRMRKWGAEATVVQIKADLVSKYVARKALLEELSMV